jgi:hypothetical protein
VQIKRGATHDLKIHYMASFLTAFESHFEMNKVDKVDIFMLISDKANFKVPSQSNATGSLTKWNWDLQQLRVVSVPRTGT